MTEILEGEDVRALVEIGFMALSAGLADQAATIFQGVAAARPAGEAGPLGLAMVALSQGRPSDAVAVLRKLPPSDAVLTYLGLALARDGQKAEAKRLLTEIIDTAAGTPFAELAEGALADLKL